MLTPSAEAFALQAGEARVDSTAFLGARGYLWSSLADHLLLLLRRVLDGARSELRVAVPQLLDSALFPRATRRFDYSLGERDLGPVTLPLLLERYVEIGARL